MAKGKEAKPHIGIFGRRNNGKSSLINVLAGQEVSIVSDFAGTTTDPVKKSMEITGLGPCVLVDTAGIDDTGTLGSKRIASTLKMLDTIDLALLVVLSGQFDRVEQELVAQFKKRAVPFLIVINKSDLSFPEDEFVTLLTTQYKVPVVVFSAQKNPDLAAIVSVIRKELPESAYKTTSLIGDVVQYGDVVLLIVPIDTEAPEGRLILPQVQTIRDALDNDCICVVCKERELDMILENPFFKPALAVTDSQIFLKADASIPSDIPLTSFSILLARQKGDFSSYLKGTPKIASLKDDDRILILESCTHHVSCDDIGRMKIPRWISNFTGKRLHYEVVSGLNRLPRDIRDYALVVQCGGCVLTRRQLLNRLRPAVEAGVPVTNYGMAIAWVHGIYNRSVAPFVEIDNQTDNYL
ncbi:MAG: [FeFe] hydrogenase H-cluster maturation GTPase HydF [Bacteroidetes bacterium]|nr:MAG: [FeFe] hydrogenase H-cluster maturation GTPase HydF [Bacteroidota bacterium]